MTERILVTTALPYANGSIHLGHVLEAIQADIFVRFQRAIGNECYFFCADDTHGTPIMLAASKAGVGPQEFIQKVHSEHYKDLTSFGISYNNYYTTDSPENQSLANEIYLKLKMKGDILPKNIKQAYCEHDKMFLPDRFIKGTCPKCGAKDQYGDSCEVCGATYTPTDLKEPKCAICGNIPIEKESKHLFFQLANYESKLKEWVSKEGRLIEGAKKKLDEWFATGLKDWDISRDGPYFGFPIPEEENKYFYVWLDAPIGYMASSLNYFEKKINHPDLFPFFWKEGKGRIIHFIGKDILYFHALFWPAMLMGSGFTTPDTIHVHGFMTVNGEKMSKSRGTFVNASTFVRYNDPEHFRYYMAARLGSGMEDVDISFNDFVTRVNSDLIGNLVNILSRVSGSLLNKLDRKLSNLDEEGHKLIQTLLERKDEIQKQFQDRNYQKVVREITQLGDIVNKYINDKAPWQLIQSNPDKTRTVITNACNAGFILFTYLYPITPIISKKVYELLKVNDEPSFLLLNKRIENVQLPPYQTLSNRASEKGIEAMIEDTKKEVSPTVNTKIPSHSTNPTVPTSSLNSANTNDKTITIEELQKVELRVGAILQAESVEGADKLLRLTVDLGPLGLKNVFAGIKSSYKPEDLVGLKVVVVANLKPRKMKFGISEAMLLATGEEGKLTLFCPHRDANPGDLLR